MGVGWVVKEGWRGGSGDGGVDDRGGGDDNGDNNGSHGKGGGNQILAYARAYRLVNIWMCRK